MVKQFQNITNASGHKKIREEYESVKSSMCNDVQTFLVRFNTKVNPSTHFIIKYD